MGLTANTVQGEGVHISLAPFLYLSCCMAYCVVLGNTPG